MTFDHIVNPYFRRICFAFTCLFALGAVLPIFADDQLQPQLVRLQELDPPENGSYACLSGDGLLILWEVGGRIWMAQRESAESLFEHKKEVSYGRHPFLSTDGLELFSLTRRADGGQGESLHVATRSSVDAAFSRPREITELSREASPKSPSISSDGLSLYFNRMGRDGKTPEFVVSTRTSTNASWLTPKVLRVNRNGITGAFTWVSTDDGSWLLCSQEPSSGPDGNIYVWTKNDNGTYSDAQLIRIDGLVPLIGRAPRYVAATKELYFTKVVDRGKFELWVVRDFDLASVRLD